MQAHLDSLQDQIEYLRGELEIRNDDLRRKDTIIAQMNQTLTAMAQRIPELEASAEPLESVVTEPRRMRVMQPPPERGKPSWWRRIFQEFCDVHKARRRNPRG